MIKEAIATGETNEIAFKNACMELGVEPEKAKMEVLEEAVKKTFGLFGGNPAKVKAIYEFGPAKKAEAYLRTLLEKMNVTGIVLDTTESEDSCNINIDGDDIKFIIGYRGDILDSLQYLASLVANQGEEKYYRVSLDVGNFREKRKETLENLAKKMAAKSLRISRNQRLEPMNPYERRIIHTIVSDIEGVKSWSEGADLGRHVVIGPVDGEKYRPKNRQAGNRGKGNYNNNNRGNRKNNDRINPKISETAEQPFSPAPLDTTTERKKAEDSPLYGRIR